MRIVDRQFSLFVQGEIRPSFWVWDLTMSQTWWMDPLLFHKMRKICAKRNKQQIIQGLPCTTKLSSLPLRGLVSWWKQFWFFFCYSVTEFMWVSIGVLWNFESLCPFLIAVFIGCRIIWPIPHPSFIFLWRCSCDSFDSFEFLYLNGPWFFPFGTRLGKHSRGLLTDKQN